jgi:hypothetical protein
MRDALTFFVPMFVLTALAEWFVLRRWYLRRSLTFCIVAVAAPSGAAWTAYWAGLFWIRWGAKVSSEWPPSSAGLPLLVFSVLVDMLIFAAIALVPAGGVALIYRRMKKRHDDVAA